MHVLLIDDDDGFLSATSRLLGLLDHSVSTANSIATAKRVLSKAPKNFDRILIDLMLPDGSGLELLEECSKHNDKAKITIITGNSAVKSLVHSMYGENINYLIKPINLDSLKSLFDDGDKAPSRANKRAADDKFHFGGLIGESQAMKELYEKIARVAKTRANVLLVGESGVGKEVVANAIHFVSNASGELIATNCGAFSRELISSELFGHEKGAFTGAISKKEGIFELANNGTVFLDEITEMPIDMQPTLLRVLETKQFQRVGGAKLINFDARVISATNRPEAKLISEKVMREDLYFRLAVFPIHIPPLRDRKEDLPALAHYFLGELNKEHDSAFVILEQDLQKLSDYHWPGNVRELRHFIHRAFIMTPEDSKVLQLGKIESPFDQGISDSRTKGISPGRTISDVEKELIITTLESTDGDKQKAAEMLGVSLKTLYNRMKSYDDEC